MGAGAQDRREALLFWGRSQEPTGLEAKDFSSTAQMQRKFDSINNQLNSAKEIYSDVVEQDLQAAAAEAEADAFAERELQMNVDLPDDDGFNSEEQERRGDFYAATAMGLLSGVFPTGAGRIGTGRGRRYFRQGATASSGVSKFFEGSEEVKSGTVRSLESGEEDAFFNPLAKIDPGAIGDSPPPTDAFNRRRWAAQRRAQRPKGRQQ